MDRVVPDDPLEAASGVDDLPRVGLGVVGLLQVLAVLQALVEARAAAHDRLRDQLRDPIARAVVESEHAGGVAGRRARRHLAEGDDLRDRLAAVLVGHVTDHALTAADREVDVDVRHRPAGGVQEALEQEVVLERVDVGDAEAVGDDRAGRGATARTDRDAVLLRVADEVPDDQEVRGEAHLLDHAELELEPGDGLGRRRVAVAAAQAFGGDAAEHLLGLGPVRRRKARQQQLAEGDLDVAALGDLERVRNRLRPGRERLVHLLRGLQVELVRVEAQLRRLERRLRLHAEQCGVIAVVLAAQVVHVRGPDERPAELAGDPGDPLVGLVLLGDAVDLELEVDVLGAEDLQQVVDVGTGVVGAVLDEAPAESRGETAGQGDHALRVTLEQARVDVRLAARETLQKTCRAELDQVLEAGLVRGQQRQVVALPLRLLLDLPDVVDEVGLEAHDRLDPVLAARLEELDRSVHHAVVGEAQRRHPELGRARRHRVDLVGAVEQRVFAVDV